jgi:hypothetical protein
VAHIAVGCVGGLLVVFVGTPLRRLHEPDEVKAASTPPIPLRAMWDSLRSFDEHARDGVRRAIPLAILISIGSILLAGAPTGDVASWAGHRLLDTILGCAIALVATYLLWPRDREAKESVPVPAA